ncbi:tripartite tricarboxylate transporter substrate-binding protein [Reyranella sp.]|jgi:tripartite-type tricarboxylate transporter receptor subunit TctC|uniref:tripartite tricarboxylate transporter substrate-binding protein n=1 Tax=Reyranella sp. TaxID=1929291 RepID=UPI000BC5F2AF|nr:tripartite tricarboxylate transporter substrate-binding protein [Reyranella sp.]OYY38636.1 MAG: hypothetical protein B7Y57_20175 [Rhodospirillales bacterium 35-66-84]OYZ91849.1 MAG: hypothetical protein B7Y08_23720 [Rhodospirillales bacterium 24-66-33]OZB21677.1 MAG: hypothetical protein B7X63_26405 [Rhodospirillales bacterium 39-66-50]HQS15535.1 tripartite tricarboxylate transporter substrate-binding protein [Reyranella sp.]HQT12061.1 tripartite tricarboxylate transporter substrate-binding
MAVIQRRALVVGLTALGAAPFGRAWANAPLEVLHGYTAGSVTGQIARFVGAVLASKGRPAPTLRAIPGDHGFAPVPAFLAGPARGSRILVADTLTLMMNGVAQGKLAEVERLVPVAKVTNGYSTALITGAKSGLKSWADVVSAARARGLKLAGSGRLSAYGPALAWVAAAAPGVTDVDAPGNDRIFEAVLSGTTAIGVVTTDSIAAMMARGGETPTVLATFGAARSAAFPTVPTFAELTGDRQRDYTFSYSVFAPPGSAGSFVESIARDLAGPFPNDLVSSLGQLGARVAAGDAQLVRETMQRDLRVARSFL